MKTHQATTLLLFWDYDTQWGADRSRSPGGQKKWGYLEFQNTERLLQLHAEYDIKACFAVVGAATLPGERPYHDPDQIRRIHAAGHEIASHSFRHDWLPGLTQSELLDTLRQSKDALEQCVGAPVVTFVPPYNQPFRYPRKLAPAFSERRIAGKHAVTIPALCIALRVAGYQFARVSYFPLPDYIRVRLFGGRAGQAGRLETISGLTCIRLNTPCGFGPPTLNLLDRVVRQQRGGFVVVYAHPHSLHNGSPQDEKYLIPFFERINALRRQGLLTVARPADVLAGTNL